MTESRIYALDISDGRGSKLYDVIGRRLPVSHEASKGNAKMLASTEETVWVRVHTVTPRMPNARRCLALLDVCWVGAC